MSDNAKCPVHAMTEPTNDEAAFQRASHRHLNRIGVVSRMSQDERRQFVVDFLGGRVFTDAQIPPRSGDIRQVFMVLAFAPFFEGWEESDLEKIGVLWEYMDRAESRYINGLPAFFSMRVMHREDWDRCREAIVREREHQHLQQDIEV